MSKAKPKSYPEIKEIRDDLDSLRDNVIGLTKHIKKDGVEQAEEMSAYAKKSIVRGQDELKKIEDQVRKQPGKSLAVAFAGGLIASMLLNRRG